MTNDDKRVMRRPAAVTRYMDEFEETEDDVKGYIMRQIEFFKQIPQPATTEAGWLALKMGCTKEQAGAALRWVKISQTEKEP